MGDCRPDEGDMTMKHAKESQIVEWKETWRDDYLKWICGFANAQGGTLVIGRNDRGETVGVRNAKKLIEDLPNKIRNLLGLVLDINLLKDPSGSEIIEIVVPHYPFPVSYQGQYYYRSGSTNQLLTGLELDRLLRQKGGSAWETTPMFGLSLRHLDTSKINDFIRKAVATGRLSSDVLKIGKLEFLEKMNLVRDGRPNHAAALLFAKDMRFHPVGASVKIGFFANDADILYQDVIKGPLFSQVEQTIETLYLKFLKAKISYHGIQRIERYPFPEAAIREAVLNAVIHKDYAGGIPVQISAYEDRLYVANIGQLPMSWTVKDLLEKHVSKPFNPIIAHAFYLAGYVESWGRGVEKIMNACREDGIPAPSYTVHPGDIMLRFDTVGDRLYVARNEGTPTATETAMTKDRTAVTEDRMDSKVRHKAKSRVENGKSRVESEESRVENGKSRVENEESRVENGGNGAKDGKKKKVKSSVEILRMISETPDITVRQIAINLGVSLKAVEKNVKILRESGSIRRVGPKKGGHWEVVNR
jgi:ATP-dependent DNA helicase RecG